MRTLLLGGNPLARARAHEQGGGAARAGEEPDVKGLQASGMLNTDDTAREYNTRLDS